MPYLCYIFLYWSIQVVGMEANFFSTDYCEYLLFLVPAEVRGTLIYVSRKDSGKTKLSQMMWREWGSFKGYFVSGLHASSKIKIAVSFNFKESLLKLYSCLQNEMSKMQIIWRVESSSPATVLQKFQQQ